MFLCIRRNLIKWSMNSKIIVKWQGKYEWYSKVYLLACDLKYKGIIYYREYGVSYDLTKIMYEHPSHV